MTVHCLVSLKALSPHLAFLGEDDDGYDDDDGHDGDDGDGHDRDGGDGDVGDDGDDFAP